MRDIQLEITNAIDHAYTQQEVEMFEAKRNSLVSQFLAGKLELRKFRQAIAKVEEYVSQVTFDTPEALKEGLLLAGLSEDEAAFQVEQQLIRHHSAIDIGLPVRFSLLFYRTLAMRLAVLISTQINLMPNLPADTVKESLSQTLAP